MRKWPAYSFPMIACHIFKTQPKPPPPALDSVTAWPPVKMWVQRMLATKIRKNVFIEFRCVNCLRAWLANWANHSNLDDSKYAPNIQPVSLKGSSQIEPALKCHTNHYSNLIFDDKSGALKTRRQMLPESLFVRIPSKDFYDSLYHQP